MRTITSLERPVGEEGGAELGDLLASDEIEPHEEVEIGLRDQTVRAALDELPEQEREVIALRFGVDGESPRRCARPAAGLASRRSGSAASSTRRSSAWPSSARWPRSRKWRRAMWGVLKRTVREFRDDNLTDWAAALTYYAILSIFPALLVLVSVLGLIGESATQPLLDNLARSRRARPGHLHQRDPEPPGQPGRGRALLRSSACSRALWSASGYIGAFMRASNAIYDVRGGSADLEDAADPDRPHRR